MAAPKRRQAGGEEFAEGTEHSVPVPSLTKNGDWIELSFYIEATGLSPALSNGGSGAWEQRHKTETTGEGLNFTLVTFVKKYEGEAGPYKLTWGGTKHGVVVRWAVIQNTSGPNVSSAEAILTKTNKTKNKAITTTLAETLEIWLSCEEGPDAMSVVPTGFSAAITTDNGFYVGEKTLAAAAEQAQVEGTLTSTSKSVVHLIAWAPIHKVQEAGFSPPSVAEYTTSGMANFAVGDMVIVNFGGSQSARISSISGGGVTTWHRAVLVENSEKAEDGAEIWWGIVTTGGTNNPITVKFTKATTAFDPLVVSEWAGLNALDETSTNTGHSSTMATKKVAPSEPGELFICIGRILEESKSGAPSGGWTEMSAAGHSGNGSAFILAAASGEEATSWAMTATDYWAMGMAVFSSVVPAVAAGALMPVVV